MFSGLTYFFDHSIYFAWLCHVHPLCKHEGGPKSKSLRKETPLKIQKYKEIHVSGKNLETKCFRACRHRPLLHILKLMFSSSSFQSWKLTWRRQWWGWCPCPPPCSGTWAGRWHTLFPRASFWYTSHHATRNRELGRTVADVYSPWSHVLQWQLLILCNEQINKRLFHVKQVRQISPESHGSRACARRYKLDPALRQNQTR